MIVIAVLAFLIPIILRRYFEAIQGIIAVAWIIFLGILPAQDPPSEVEAIMHKILFVSLPVWVFGSLIAFKARAKDISIAERQFHENTYHYEKKD